MPARKKPVKNRRVSKLIKLLLSQMTPKLNKDPSKALTKNTFEGENRSAIVKTAKISVPIINPNCTAEVKCPKSLTLRLKFMIRSFITPFPANQSDVQQNCDITITGRIILECFNYCVFSCIQRVYIYLFAITRIKLWQEHNPIES